ncbi:FkbM family methyltransferase [uncultured Brachyspira sp.]|uniref:FkbM family methyltransferase n=1 Tax=uncultured Brachyspira sp. TaxID=221953 RepID=UPI0025974308|nr:FkbM family methyltransferase [uncultured Brachyspira sp.]
MTSKTIDNIVWFIPFRKLRDNIRDFMHFIYDLNNPLQAWDSFLVIKFRKHIKNDTNFYQKYLNLIKNFDNESVEIINNIVGKICNYNDIDEPVYFSQSQSQKIKELLEEYNNKIIKINEELFIYDKYILPKNHFEIEVFYDKSGMDYIKNINQVKNKNIIDAGGYIGDSAIVFSDYTDKNVYSFEPFLQNYNLMLKTIELNKKNNIIPVNMALGSENKEISIYSNSDTANSGLSIETKQSDINSFENKVKMVTLDSYVKENNIEVGLIKTDLEGFEQSFLKGAIETIKEQKPVLIISIYHNYSDFFEIKPMLENLNLGYKFRIIKNRLNKVILETKLLAEVY